MALASTSFYVAVLLVLLLLAATGLAQDQYCPKEITTKQVSEKAPPGWTAGQARLLRSWRGIAFFDGPPEQEASLVYDSYTKSKTVDVAMWRFDHSAHIWLSCGYHATAVKLSKPLPAKMPECRVIYSREIHVDGNGEIKAISCK